MNTNRVHTTKGHTMSTLMPIICSECGKGNYRTHGVHVAACRLCNHEVTMSDLLPNLEVHEYVELVGDIVSVRSFA